MSDYQIRFSPQMEINPSDFVTAWNESPDCKAVAEAEVSHSAAIVCQKNNFKISKRATTRVAPTEWFVGATLVVAPSYFYEHLELRYR
jgi:hypothetical protein